MPKIPDRDDHISKGRPMSVLEATVNTLTDRIESMGSHDGDRPAHTLSDSGSDYESHSPPPQTEWTEEDEELYGGGMPAGWRKQEEKPPPPPPQKEEPPEEQDRQPEQEQEVNQPRPSGSLRILASVRARVRVRK